MANKQITGSKTPRLWTRPKMSRFKSYGHEVIEFARDVLKHPLDPWQEWLVVHAGELLEDGRTPRFRQVLVLVARQNGKTTLLMVLALYWLFKARVKMILGTSSLLVYAKESWAKAVEVCESDPELARRILVKTGAGMEELALLGESSDNSYQIATRQLRRNEPILGRYKIAASNRGGGRSLSVEKLILDEVREHQTWEAYNAVVPTMTAQPYAQVWMISNQGDDRSVVLKSLREQALQGTDDRLGLFEWSAPDGSKPTNMKALAAANPNLGHRISLENLMGEARRAEAAGGDQLAGFLTEHLCMWVPMLNPAIDPDAWAACYMPGEFNGARQRVTLCLDVAGDQMHATLYAAAIVGKGVTRVDPVAAWQGMNCMKQLRQELPFHIDRIKPRALGWFPNGPAAALSADLIKRQGWPPVGMTVEAIRADVSAVCMGFAEQVISRQIVHSGDPLLDAHIAAAEKLPTGDAWRFTRRGVGHVDAVYAAAGAVHLARTQPAPARFDLLR